MELLCRIYGLMLKFDLIYDMGIFFFFILDSVGLIIGKLSIDFSIYLRINLSVDWG